MESDEGRMRKAAHLMVSSLAGSLALVTCREPLRSSLAGQLRHLLANTMEANQLEHTVQVGVCPCPAALARTLCALVYASCVCFLAVQHSETWQCFAADHWRQL